MDKIEQYTEEELSSMGWGFKTVETPEPEPVEQKPTIEILRETPEPEPVEQKPTIEILRETPDQYVTPYVRISGIELTDKHIVAFYRKIHGHYRRKGAGTAGKDIYSPYRGWVHPYNITYSAGGQQRTSEMVFFKGRNTNDAIIKSEFTPLQMSEGVYYLQTRGQSKKVWLTYADLMLPFCYGQYGDQFNIVYSAGRQYRHTFQLGACPTGSLGKSSVTFNARGLGFALCEKVSAGALIRLTDIAEFSLALTVVCEDTRLHATLRL